MLPLDVIKKYYPNVSDEEPKEIQEIVYLLACAIMQECYGSPLGEPRSLSGSEWMGGFKDTEQEEKL